MQQNLPSFKNTSDVLKMIIGRPGYWCDIIIHVCKRLENDNNPLLSLLLLWVCILNHKNWWNIPNVLC